MRKSKFRKRTTCETQYVRRTLTIEYVACLLMLLLCLKRSLTMADADMADMVDKVLAAAETSPDELEAAAKAIGMNSEALLAMAQFSRSQSEAAEKSAHKVQLSSSMRRVLMAPARKVGGKSEDFDRRLRVTSWNQFRKTEQYSSQRAALAADITALIEKYAEAGEACVENTRILINTGVVELRGKDRKADEDDE